MLLKYRKIHGFSTKSCKKLNLNRKRCGKKSGSVPHKEKVRKRETNKQKLAEKENETENETENASELHRYSLQGDPPHKLPKPVCT